MNKTGEKNGNEYIHVYGWGITRLSSKATRDRKHCHASFCLNTILNDQAVYRNKVLVDHSSNGFLLFHRAVRANLDSTIKSVLSFFIYID